MDVDDVVFERRAVEPVVQRFSPDVNPVVTHHSADAYFAAVGLQDELLSFLLEAVQLQELFCDTDAVARNFIGDKSLQYLRCLDHYRCALY